ncbi:MAG: DUF2520 domain-containing protein [Bacteroidetes bacterium]|nr:DUF2520 domain-containing protein [Bacteroidota bacterium]
MPTKTVVLIGAGRLATNLGIALVNNKFKILQVYSRTAKSAKELASKLNCNYTNNFNQLDNSASLYIISVKDDVLPVIAKKIALKNKLVVHTSGSINMDVLKNVSSSYGIFYPLQTFNKNKTLDFREIPVFIEASDLKTKKQISTIAKSISKKVHYADSETRKLIHLSAVFACNFSNHMYTIASTLLQSKKILFSILQPLVVETAKKAFEITPNKAQTGPAIRRDQKVIEEHLKLLKATKTNKEIYSLLTKSIQQTR